MKLLKQRLEEVIKAGQNAKKDLDMTNWVCKTSCCLCGDWALHTEQPDTETAALDFAYELDDLVFEKFEKKGSCIDAEFIWGQFAIDRYTSAEYLGIFSEEELKHKHLTEDHCDREIAHDFIRLFISKLGD